MKCKQGKKGKKGKKWASQYTLMMKSCKVRYNGRKGLEAASKKTIWYFTRLTKLIKSK